MILATADGKRLELQAENEDEMVQWIQAIKRCAAGAPGRPKIVTRGAVSSTKVRSSMVDQSETAGQGNQCLGQFTPDVSQLNQDFISR
jgi:hypothetical protein